jgi:hypothetical protein
VTRQAGPRGLGVTRFQRFAAVPCAQSRLYSAQDLHHSLADVKALHQLSRY